MGKSLLMLAIGAAVLVLSAHLCIFIFTNTQPVGLVLHFPSLIIVFGGVIGLALILSEPNDVARFLMFLFGSTARQRSQLHETESKLEPMLDLYTDKGGKALSDYVEKESLPKVWRAVAANLSAGIPAKDVKQILDFQLRKAFVRIDCDLAILRKLTSLAPSVGMLGTVLGLIRLLANMKDFDSLGTDMSLALITTLYGIILGNFFFVPLVNKLEKRRILYLKSNRLAQQWLSVLDGSKPSYYLKSRIRELAGG